MVRTERATYGGGSFLLEGLVGLAIMLLCVIVLLLTHRGFVVRAGIDLAPADIPIGENRSDPIPVRVSSAGTVHFRGKRIELAALRSTLEAARFESPHAALVVQGEQGARASQIARVIDQCRLTGARDIRFTLVEE